MSPTEEDFDDMHHALGRPDGPHVEPYRNRYICEADGPQAARFLALGLWDKAGTMNGGRDGIYQVTLEGRAQVMAWLVASQRAKGLRPWIVTGKGMTASTVIAKSASAAKYDVYLRVSDTYDFGGFLGFLKLGVKARVAA